jgi:hypothetical protein
MPQPVDFYDMCVVSFFLWQYYANILVTGLDKCSSDGVGDTSGSSSSTYMMPISVQEAQEQQQHAMQQLPPGALQLLQHWPAMQLELLLLVDDVSCKVLLLQTVARMLQVCAIADASLKLTVAARSALIQPLLQLVLPHVTDVLRQQTAAAGSSTALHTSSGSSSSSSSSTSAAQQADALERALHAVLLECINGGEQLMSSVAWKGGAARLMHQQQAMQTKHRVLATLPRVLTTYRLLR